MTIPAVVQTCWPVDTSMCEGFENHDEPIRELATALAGMTMRMLTGYQLGACPVTIRPCSIRCVQASPNWVWQGGTFIPVNMNGTWTNMVCDHCGLWCDCGLGRKSITLPGGIGEITQVKVDGAILPSTAYEIHNDLHLVRTDGGEWPSTQDMASPDTAAGTWSVTYTPGLLVDGTGAYVAGILACQYGKAITGGKCELPRGVTQIARQGITMTLTPGSFPNGLTGIQTVDAYITRWNPHGLREGPTIWAPGMPEHRVVR
jgi:hypothetical protein